MGLQIVKFTADVTIKQLLRKTLTFYRGVIPSCANLTPHEDRTLSRVQQWFLNFSLPRFLKQLSWAFVSSPLTVNK